MAKEAGPFCRYCSGGPCLVDRAGSLVRRRLRDFYRLGARRCAVRRKTASHLMSKIKEGLDALLFVLDAAQFRFELR